MEREYLFKVLRECVAVIQSERGWNYNQLAESLGMHREALRRLRMGEVENIPFDKVVEIFKMANRSIDRVAGITDDSVQDVNDWRERALRAERIVDILSSQIVTSGEDSEYDTELSPNKLLEYQEQLERTSNMIKEMLLNKSKLADKGSSGSGKRKA